MMKVSELIEFLQKQPQDIQVAYECYSEACLLDGGIRIDVLSTPRADGWIHLERDDKPTQTYLLFPGN